MARDRVHRVATILIGFHFVAIFNFARHDVGGDGRIAVRTGDFDFRNLLSDTINPKTFIDLWSPAVAEINDHETKLVVHARNTRG